MATRRNVAGQQTTLDGASSKDAPQEAASNIAPAVPTAVILKLLFFTFAMVVAPIGSYFLSVNSIFKGNSTYAGAMAAVIANVVLVGYIIVAVREDQGEQADVAILSTGKGKKAE